MIGAEDDRLGRTKKFNQVFLFIQNAFVTLKLEAVSLFSQELIDDGILQGELKGGKISWWMLVNESRRLGNVLLPVSLPRQPKDDRGRYL